MNIEKAVTLNLDNEEVYLLKLLARMCEADLNERFKSHRQLWDLSFSEMQRMATFARSLDSL